MKSPFSSFSVHLNFDESNEVSSFVCDNYFPAKGDNIIWLGIDIIVNIND